MQFDIPFHINGQGKKIYHQVTNNTEDDLANVEVKFPQMQSNIRQDIHLSHGFHKIFRYTLLMEMTIDPDEINRTATNTFNTNTFEIYKNIYITVFAPNVKSEGVYFAHNNISSIKFYL